MRKILIGVGVLVVVIVGAVVWLWSNLDGLVKTAIETAGTKVAGVPVTVSKVTIDIRNGKASIDGLMVANPKGYTTPTAIALGTISVSLDPANATKKPLLINDITIAAPVVTYEVTAQGGSNISDIKKNVDSFTASNAGAGGDAAKESAPAAKSDASASDAKSEALIIHKLTISGGKVVLAAPVPGAKAEAALQTISMTDIGKAKGGASPADVATQILDALSGAAIKGGSGLMLGNAADMAKGAVGDAVKGLFGK